MKNKLNSLVIPVLALLAVGTFAVAAPQASHTTVKPVAAKEVKGIQKLSITVSEGKYSPAVISVKRGKPVELTFIGGKHMGCGGTVVFKSLKQFKDVQTGKSIVFKFTPKSAGTIEFTCGMGMYHGKVIVK